MNPALVVLSTYGTHLMHALRPYQVAVSIAGDKQAALAQIRMHEEQSQPSQRSQRRLFFLIDTTSLAPPDVVALAREARQSNPRCIVMTVFFLRGNEVQEYRTRLSDTDVRVHHIVPQSPEPEKQLVEFVIEVMGLRRSTPIAVANAKGGIGKTLLIAVVAYAMIQRGLRVLIVDGDVTNSGVIPHFRIPQGYYPYTALQRSDSGSGRFTTDSLNQIIYRHESTGLHFLLGSDDANLAADISMPGWSALITQAINLPQYDVVLVDTSPEIKRRPYALDIALERQGWVLVPAPPGPQERYGVATTLSIFTEAGCQDRCLVVLMEPERGVVSSLAHFKQNIQTLWPQAHIIGQLPRDPWLVSSASEIEDRYVSPMAISPYGRFARQTHQIVETIGAITGLRFPRPIPSLPWYRRIFARGAPASDSQQTIMQELPG